MNTVARQPAAVPVIPCRKNGFLATLSIVALVIVAALAVGTVGGLWMGKRLVQSPAEKKTSTASASNARGTLDLSRRRAVAADAPTQPMDNGFIRASNTQPGADSLMASTSDRMDASSAQPGVPAPLYQPPTDPGSKFIKDPRTGRIIGIDGSAGAAAEEAAMRQQWPRALPVNSEEAYAKVQPGRSVVVQARPVYASQPVAQMAPSTSLPAKTGTGLIQAAPVATTDPVYDPEMPVLRAQPVNPGQRLSSPALDSLGRAAIPRAQPVISYPPRPAKKIAYSRVYTLPDGTRIISRTEDVSEQ